MTGTILVTGGAGFIGSHTCVELLDHGYDLVLIDDHSNSSPAALARVQELAGRPIATYVGDVRDAALLDTVLTDHEIGAVVHFAAKKAVGESARIPIDYYSINVAGTLAVVAAMLRHGVDRLVFSSSCSIYGDSSAQPLDERAPARPTNPYARSKWMCEQIMADACSRYEQLSVTALRYFNPVGAHSSGRLGEEPSGQPNNVLPFITQAATGRRGPITVFGDDYDTVDGTGVRDYLHVMDVAAGHRSALARTDLTGYRPINLGTGVGTSVLQLISEFEAVSGLRVPFAIGPRRAGDVATLVADPTLARELLGWTAARTVTEACADAWQFAAAHPSGYALDRPLARL